MVVFSCMHCGESLQKPKVEKHYYTTCRNQTKFLTCVDCFKDFRNEEYTVHTKCITEEERYAAKGTYSQALQAKGAVKQESWTDMIKSATSGVAISKPDQQTVVDTILNSVNVPRKKQKFMNFVKSATGNRASIHAIEAVWNILEKYKEQHQPISEANTPGKKSDSIINNGIETKKEKIKAQSKPNVEENHERNEKIIFSKDLITFTKFSTENQEKISQYLITLEEIPLIKKKFIKLLKRCGQGFDSEDIKAVWEAINNPSNQENNREENNVQETKLNGTKAEENSEFNKNAECGENIVPSFDKWTEQVKATLKTIKSSKKSEKKIIKIILRASTNIPSKKKKFTKFIKKQLEDSDLNDIENIWNLLQTIEATKNVLKENDTELSEIIEPTNKDDLNNPQAEKRTSQKSKKRKFENGEFETKQTKKRKNGKNKVDLNI